MTATAIEEADIVTSTHENETDNVALVRKSRSTSSCCCGRSNEFCARMTYSDRKVGQVDGQSY
jgi:hypothetical protein